MATPREHTGPVRINHPYLNGAYPRAFAHRGWHLDDLHDMENSLSSFRRAVAEGRIRMAAETARAIRAGDAPKGDVLGTARLAGIMAGKRTATI